MFYESTARDGRKDAFSSVRAQRIDRIKSTLEQPNADLFKGWDKALRRYDSARRVAVVYEDFVVVAAMGLRLDGSLKAKFVTCYQADKTIASVRQGNRLSGHEWNAFVNSDEWYEGEPQEKQRPLIRHEGSAAETSIGSKPMGSELSARYYPRGRSCRY